MEREKELAYILGVLRDGSLPEPSGEKYEVTIATDVDKEWLKLIAEKISKVFLLPQERIKLYKIIDRKGKIPYFRLKIYSKSLYKTLKEYYPERLQMNWKTPRVILKAPLEVQQEYVRGFYDAEGGCRDVTKFINGKTKTIYPWLSIRCKHSKGRNEPLEFVREVLRKFEIKGYIRDNDELTVTGKLNLLRFYNYFTPFNPRKRRMLKHLLIFYGLIPADA